ncbi:hypothetical protein [Paucidesulfovibrio longus]|uniref:hypothetical protein n=1 Tax=Paucidesulfovibrio longus TaxID=889 RepID=UPI0012DCBDF6|nr:hypothetical protein [Paucidesulfovibrio longus]
MGTITLNRIISAHELLERWTGITERELVAMTNPDSLDVPFLKGYKHIKTLVQDDNVELHICCDDAATPYVFEIGPTVQIRWEDNDPEQISKGIIFDFNAVESIEMDNPTFKAKIKKVKEKTKKHEWISCATLPERWECSPDDVIDIIEKHTPTIHPDYPNTYLSYETLSCFNIYGIDLLKFEEQYDQEISQFSYTPPHRRNAPTPNQVSPIASQTTSRPATIKDYRERMPSIVSGVLAIKRQWDSSGENSPIRKFGFIEPELWELAPAVKDKTLRAAFKQALNDSGITVWLKRGPRTQ